MLDENLLFSSKHHSESLHLSGITLSPHLKLQPLVMNLMSG